MCRGGFRSYMKSRKSWREKMDNPTLPKLLAVPPNRQKRLGCGVMLIPSPTEVEALIRCVHAGPCAFGRRGPGRRFALSHKFPRGEKSQGQRLRAEGRGIHAAGEAGETRVILSTQPPQKLLAFRK
jgi:hypothetical protein